MMINFKIDYFLDAFYSHNPTINMDRANPTRVSDGAQHSGNPLVGSQGTTITPQGSLQQAPQPPPGTQLGCMYFFDTPGKYFSLSFHFILFLSYFEPISN